jgi:hypothetical protein
MNRNIKFTAHTLKGISFAVSSVLIGANLAVAVTFTPPPNNQAPRRAAASGASRTQVLCEPQSKSVDPAQVASTLIPLMPKTHYGTTVSERPTILVYLPETSATAVFFSLKTESKQLHYQFSLPISGKAGILQLQLPKQAPALELGQHYQWFLALKCQGQLRPSSPIVSGWIQRIPLPAAGPQQQTPSVQTASALGALGIWYDAAATLIQLRQSQPHNQAIVNHLRDYLTSSSVVLSEREVNSIATAQVLTRP